MTIRTNFVDLDGARPAPAVVVIDVLRAFTTVPWALFRGAARILAVDTLDRAHALRDEQLPDALLAGEVHGETPAGFDLGNSPTEVQQRDVSGRTIVHRTTAGTQGLARTAGSPLVLAASFVTATATARRLAQADVEEVTFVITGASHGRDGDEDLACAELIAAMLDGSDPDPAPFLARVATSDAGRAFAPDGPAWAPPEDLACAIEVDRFDFTVRAEHDTTLEVIAVVADRPRGATERTDE
ncbi:MAG: 2-phosphosulfolactate phosphatase [Nitriliruptoraceae bacterium]